MISWLISLAMIGAGVALIGSFFMGPGSSELSSNSSEPGGFNVPQLSNGQRTAPVPAGPRDKTLELTIPAMSRIDKSEIPNATGTQLNKLDNHAAIHLEGTGYPWQQEANVYIAGHRLGYPRTDSFLAFYDLDKLENGDRVFVKDSNGKKYTYKVYKKMVVSPANLQVTEPIEGKNILTLQTCTLPDYSERLVVQAELVKPT